MSDTPRTDALCDTLPWNDEFLPLRDLCYTLERELAEKKAELRLLIKATNQLVNMQEETIYSLREKTGE